MDMSDGVPLCARGGAAAMSADEAPPPGADGWWNSEWPAVLAIGVGLVGCCCCVFMLAVAAVQWRSLRWRNSATAVRNAECARDRLHPPPGGADSFSFESV